MLRLTARLDLDDRTRSTAGGLHLAAMGSVWQALVQGFAGSARPATPCSIDSRLPASWDALEIPPSVTTGPGAGSGWNTSPSGSRPIGRSGPLPGRRSDGSSWPMDGSSSGEGRQAGRRCHRDARTRGHRRQCGCTPRPLGGGGIGRPAWIGRRRGARRRARPGRGDGRCGCRRHPPHACRGAASRTDRRGGRAARRRGHRARGPRHPWRRSAGGSRGGARRDLHP